MTNTEIDGSRLRVHVAIACYGNKNIHFLKQIIRTYRKMRYKVDVTVITEGPKDVGDDVKLVVGLPSRNPWSLPFAHKAVFAQSVDQYDLFVYSEDDMEITEANIEAFLRVTPYLAPDEIAGYLRYEVDSMGLLFFPDVHSAFHWKPDSVKQRGEYTVAEFTNAHAGFYILTQNQLKQAIASGGFFRGPYEGRYGLPETAATDPYTCCGFQKVICISNLQDFLIHHMSNRYVGRLGLAQPLLMEQIQTLIDIGAGVHPVSTLCNVESNLLRAAWSKSYYEEVNGCFLKMVSANADAILSIGCGWGATEKALRDRGATITALPLNSVVGASVARLGINVVYGTLDECLGLLKGRKFDCVFTTNLLHLQPKPGLFLDQCLRFVRKGGSFVISGPNFNFYRVWIKRVLNMHGYWQLRSFDRSGITVSGPKTIRSPLERDGFHIEAVEWFKQNALRNKNNAAETRKRLGPFTGTDWLLRARRTDIS